ncbi:transposase [Anaerotignum sp.]
MAGRPSKYETHVKARFAEIKEWLQSGATDAEIAENLGIHKSVFCKYKSQYKELNELCKNGRRKAVQAIKAALFKRATGFQYVESKLIEDDEGHWKKETYTKSALPDPASAMILLKHWDKENGWTNDPQQLELKKQELELKKKHLESEVW